MVENEWIPTPLMKIDLWIWMKNGIITFHRNVNQLDIGQYFFLHSLLFENEVRKWVISVSMETWSDQQKYGNRRSSLSRFQFHQFKLLALSTTTFRRELETAQYEPWLNANWHFRVRSHSQVHFKFPSLIYKFRVWSSQNTLIVLRSSQTNDMRLRSKVHFLGAWSMALIKRQKKTISKKE